LLKPKLQNHHIDGLVNRLVINVGLGKVKVRHAKPDGAIAQTWLKDGRANLCAREGAEISSAKPAGEIVVPPDAIDHHARRLGELNVEGNPQHGRSPNRNQPRVINGARYAHVANILMAAGWQWAVNHWQEKAWIASNRGVLDDCAGRVMEGLDDQVAKIIPCFVEEATEIEHGAINDGIAVQLRPNCLQDEVHIDGKRFERALNHLVCVGQLINGHCGLDLGVHACGHASDLDRHKFTGDKGCPMGRSNLAGGRKGGHDRKKGRMVSSCCMEHHLRVLRTED
jgi:hypothetical protein